jgi:23S rRNA pseudouridine1911/1915/1917 synthase
MVDTISITVSDEMAGERLDKLLTRQIPDMSRSRLKALIQESAVQVRTAQAAHTITSPSKPVKSGDVIEITIPDATEPDPQPEDIPLNVVFEDDDVILINKPPGMVVHPAPGSPTGTLVNALLHHCGNSLSGIGGVKRPGIVHRIDKDTSGLIIMAKNDIAHHGLAEQFADHSIERLYAAICKGHPNPKNGRIEGNIARHTGDRKKMAVSESGGKWAVTHYKTIANYQASGRPIASLIECKLETGRTHQVRVHMNHIGHTLIGDPVYGRSSKLSGNIAADIRGAVQGFKRQALHAKTLGFQHPRTGEALKFESEYPYDFKGLFDALMPYKV